jgi:AcrR family transcriptional regulator
MSTVTDTSVATRRRGAMLEAAILDAAWLELDECGYSAFTFESVARRAETSRPVLYRRWPTRIQLAFAAMRYHVRRNPVSVPDMGDVRSELYLLLRKFADRSPPRLTRLVFDMSEDMHQHSTRFSDLRENPLGEVLERALARGEIDATKLVPRIAQLPTALVFNEIVITQQRVSDEAIRQIVDDIFLPLVRVTAP